MDVKPLIIEGWPMSSTDGLTRVPGRVTDCSMSSTNGITGEPGIVTDGSVKESVI